MIANDAIGGQAAIAELVRRGYIVRTMADSEDGAGAQRRQDADATRRSASGAQIVSTDYYRPIRAAARRQRLDELPASAPRRRPGARQPDQRRRAVRVRICE